MPTVDIHVIKGMFSPAQKKAMIEKVAAAMAEVEGEDMRGATRVTVHEDERAAWDAGGLTLSAEEVRAMAEVGDS